VSDPLIVTGPARADEERPAAEIDDAAGQAFIHRHKRLAREGVLRVEAAAVAPDTSLVAQRLGQRLPHGDADVLHRVMTVDLQVALRRYFEIPSRVRAELLQHVVEERQSGVGGRGSRAVERQLHSDVGLLSGAHHRSGAWGIGHAASTSSSADKNRSTSCVVPAVTRSAFGTTDDRSRINTPRSTRPCHTSDAGFGGTNRTKLASDG